MSKERKHQPPINDDDGGSRNIATDLTSTQADTQKQEETTSDEEASAG